MKFPRIVYQVIAVLSIAATFSAPALAQQGRGPSTANEHARVVQLARVADKDPVATMSSPDGRWFEKWADEIPDYMFGPDNGAYWFMTTAAKGELKRVLRFHHTVSTAAFQVQNKILNPRNDPAQMEAKTLAGVEGLLRAYESLLASRPENRSPLLDQAVIVRNQGGLPAFVKALPPMPQE